MMNKSNKFIALFYVKSSFSNTPLCPKKASLQRINMQLQRYFRANTYCSLNPVCLFQASVKMLLAG